MSSRCLFFGDWRKKLSSIANEERRFGMASIIVCDDAEKRCVSNGFGLSTLNSMLVFGGNCGTYKTADCPHCFNLDKNIFYSCQSVSSHSSLPSLSSSSSSSSPPPVFGLRIVQLYDANEILHLVVFGGAGLSGYSSTIYLYSTRTCRWRVGSAGEIEGRMNCGFCRIDRYRVLITGGESYLNRDLVAGSYAEYDLRTEKLTKLGEMPTPRTGHSSAFSQKRQHLYLFGGNKQTPFEKFDVVNSKWKEIEVRQQTLNGEKKDSESECFPQISSGWSLPFFQKSKKREEKGKRSNFFTPTVNGPPNRENHSALMVNEKKMFVFGGISFSQYFLNDFWEFDSESELWKEVILRGISIPPRAEHSFLLSSPTSIIVYGGRNEEQIHDDLYEIQLSGFTLQELIRRYIIKNDIPLQW